MSSLSTRIEKTKDEHAQEELTKLQELHEERSQTEAMFILGRIKQNDHIGTAIFNNLSAQSIMALQRFQQEKKHEALGFDTFDKFLNESPYSPMTKAQYYERLAIVNKHGLDVADLLTSIGIPMRSQKLLAAGDVSIRDDKVFIGDKELETADTGVIKDVLSELFDERRELHAKLDASKKKLDDKQSIIERGNAEFDQLQRNFDALKDEGPFERALSRAFIGIRTLIEAVGQLPDDVKTKRGADDVELFLTQVYALRDAYGLKLSLEPHALELRDRVAAMKPVAEMSDTELDETRMDRAAAAIAADGGFEDLD